MLRVSTDAPTSRPPCRGTFSNFSPNIFSETSDLETDLPKKFRDHVKQGTVQKLRRVGAISIKFTIVKFVVKLQIKNLSLNQNYLILLNLNFFVNLFVEFYSCSLNQVSLLGQNISTV